MGSVLSLCFYLVDNTNATLDIIRDRHLRPLLATSKLQDSLNEIRLIESEIVYSDSAFHVSRELDRVQQRIREFSLQLDDFLSSAITQAGDREQLQKRWSYYRSCIERVADSVLQGRVETARNLSKSLSLPAYKQLTNEMARLVADTEAAAAVVYSDTRSELVRLLLYIGIASLLGCGIGIVAAVLLALSLSHNVQTLARGAERLADGQLGHTLVVRGRDELAVLATTFNRMSASLQQRERALQRANATLETRVAERTRELQQANQSLQNEIDERERLQLERDAMHGELLTAARQAGMAEIATNVLHLVGNVLTSVYVSSEMAKQRLEATQWTRLRHIAQLLSQHKGDLADFFNTDPRGSKLPEFMNVLAQHYIDSKAQLNSHLSDIHTHLDRAVRAIAWQEKYAQRHGGERLIESVPISQLVDGALMMAQAQIMRSNITVNLDLAELSNISVVVDRHKMLNVLLALLQNACEAIIEQAPSVGMLSIYADFITDDSAALVIADNGVGVSSDNLINIFKAGYSSKAGRGGFGLHCAVLNAKEMNATLEVSSDGVGCGTRFKLTLRRPQPKIRRATTQQPSYPVV